jgi:GNAT superfamily N-acetyltransferase
MYLMKQLFCQVIDSFKTCKTRGIGAGLVGLAQTVARVFYQRADYVVLEERFSKYAPAADPRPDLVIRRVTTRELVASLSPVTNLADMQRFYKLFDGGCFAFIASENDQVIGYCWASQHVEGSLNRVGAALSLGAGDAYIHDLFTAEAYRGRGIGRSLLIHCLEYLHENGYERAVAAVERDNIASLIVTRKAGYQVMGEISHSRIMLWNRFIDGRADI